MIFEIFILQRAIHRYHWMMLGCASVISGTFSEIKALSSSYLENQCSDQELVTILATLYFALLETVEVENQIFSKNPNSPENHNKLIARLSKLNASGVLCARFLIGGMYFFLSI